jgi:hypothetical protein
MYLLFLCAIDKYWTAFNKYTWPIKVALVEVPCPVNVVSSMTPASALVALLLFTGAASLHVPGCLPDEDATIVSEAMFEAPDIVAIPFRFKNLTITRFTCPSREALAQQKPSERQDLQSGIRTGGTHHNLERHSPTPIQLCGMMGGSELFKSELLWTEVAEPLVHSFFRGKFNCE